MHYQVSLPQSTKVKWSAFAGCFFREQWRTVRVVWGLDGALANQEMALCVAVQLRGVGQ